MKNKTKIYSISIITLILCLMGGYLLFGNKQQSEPLPVITALDNIEKFGYILYDNKQDLYKEHFNQLKETLNQETIDEKKYAEIISKLFVIDFYTLDNKVTNTDIGGLDFVHSDALETFTLSATDTIYKYIESNVYGERQQELPEVVETNVVNVSKSKFESEKVTDENSYNVTLEIKYKKDLKYPTEVTLTLVHVGQKLYIVEVK